MSNFLNRALLTVGCVASSACLYAQEQTGGSATTSTVNVSDFGIEPSGFVAQIITMAGPWFIAAIGIGVAFWAIPLLWRKFKGVAK